MPERRLGAHHPFWFDTVVLSNFAIAEEIAWLGARYSGQGRITAEVFEEIGAGIAAGYSMLASSRPSRLRIPPRLATEIGKPNPRKLSRRLADDHRPDVDPTVVRDQNPQRLRN